MESPSRLTLDLQQLHSVVTDHDAKDSYQVSVSLCCNSIQLLRNVSALIVPVFVQSRWQLAALMVMCEFGMLPKRWITW